MKKISKLISAILIFTFIFTIGLSNTVIVSAKESKNNTKVTHKAKNYRSKNHKKLTELKNKRTKNATFYQNSDGTVTEELHLDSIHYKDSNGKWQDISNKIVPSDEQGFQLTNEANSFKTHFAKDTNSKYITMLKLDDEHKISWSLEDANNVSLTNDKNSVTYHGILADTDLQYQPISDGLKENIILKSLEAPNVFKFDLKFDGLKPEQQSDGSIAIKDIKTNKSEFVFPKAFMMDKNNQTSSSVEMTINNTSNSSIYTLTVTADLNWLKDSSRAFPITIDPSALTQSYYTYLANGAEDTFIASNQPDYAYYEYPYCSAGYLNSYTYTTRSLMKFDLELPAGAIVTDALLSLYKYNTVATSTVTLQANRITSNWTSAVTWNTKPSVDTTHDRTLLSEVNLNGNGVWMGKF